MRSLHSKTSTPRSQADCVMASMPGLNRPDTLCTQQLPPVVGQLVFSRNKEILHFHFHTHFPIHMRGILSISALGRGPTGLCRGPNFISFISDIILHIYLLFSEEGSLYHVLSSDNPGNIFHIWLHYRCFWRWSITFTKTLAITGNSLFNKYCILPIGK